MDSVIRIFHWIGKPPALPVEVPRKKALASSNERSELLTANYQGRKTYVRTADARLRVGPRQVLFAKRVPVK